MRRYATKKSQAQYKNSHLPAYLPEVTANDSSKLKEINEFPIGKLRDNFSSNDLILIKKFDPDYVRNKQILEPIKSPISAERTQKF